MKHVREIWEEKNKCANEAMKKHERRKMLLINVKKTQKNSEINNTT